MTVDIVTIFPQMIEPALAEKGGLGILGLRLAHVHPGKEAAPGQHQGKDDTATHNQYAFHVLLSLSVTSGSWLVARGS